MTSKDTEKLDLSNYAQIEFDHREQFLLLQHIVPSTFERPYHFHPSIEVNYLHGCDMTYSFSGREFTLKRGLFCIFWAAHPHSPVKIEGDGKITNVYVNLAEFLRWSLPNDLLNSVLGGAVLCCKEPAAGDNALASRWSKETEKTNAQWQRLHALELQTRLHRLALDGWQVLLEPTAEGKKPVLGGPAINQVEKMLRFVAEHYVDPINLQDVAEAGGVSQNYAVSLFKKVLGRTIKAYITDIRIFHAKMLLAETDKKILTVAMDCGFGSLSSFYAAFQSQTGTAPATFRSSTRGDR